MNEYQISVMTDDDDEPLFRTEWMLTKAQALAVLRSLANAYEPGRVIITTRRTTRGTIKLTDESAGDFLVQSL